MMGCPLWVISGHNRQSDQCPLYPRKRTFGAANAMSALCQERTLHIPKTAYSVMQISAMPIQDMARRPLSRLGLSDLRQHPTVRYQ